MRALSSLLGIAGVLGVGRLAGQDSFKVDYLCGKSGHRKKTPGQLVVTDSQARFVNSNDSEIFSIPMRGLTAFSNAGGRIMIGFCTDTKDEVVFLYSETNGNAEAVAFKTENGMSPVIVARVDALSKPAPARPIAAPSAQQAGVPQMVGDTLYYLSPSRSFNAGLPKFWGRVDWPASWPNRGAEVSRRDTGYVEFIRYLVGMSRVDYQRLDSATVAATDSAARHRLYQSYLERVVAAGQGEVLVREPITVSGACMLCVRVRIPRACSLDDRRKKDSIRDGLLLVRGDFIYMLQVERAASFECEKYEPRRQELSCNMTRTDELLRHMTFLEPTRIVPGTLADAELQEDIQLLLWKEQANRHRDCRHEVVRVEPAPLDSSVVIAEMLAAGGAPATAAQNLVRAARDTVRQSGVVHLERWLVRSCDVVSTYQVLLMPSSGGGTDIIVRQEQPR